MNKKISFIVPAYNAEKYIEQCILSILEQNKCPWELIIIDDGSRDLTLQICRKYEEKDNRIKVVCQQNAGSAVARNTGLDMATGEWISFLDADDWISKDYLEKVYPYLQPEYDFIMYSYCEIKDDFFRAMCQNGEEFILQKEEFELLVKDVIDTERRLLEAAASRSQFWTKVYRREFLEKHQIRMQPELRMSQDVMFNLCVYNVAEKAIFIPELLYNYRILNDSTCHKYSEEQVPRILKIMNAIGEYVPKTNLGEEGEILFQKRILVSLVNACRLDFCHPQNPKSYTERYKAFLELRRQEPFKGALKWNIITKFSFKKQICMWFVKFRLFGLLNIFLKV